MNIINGDAPFLTKYRLADNALLSAMFSSDGVYLFPSVRPLTLNNFHLVYNKDT